MDISIVIPVYSRCNDLRRALTSLNSQTGCSFEIIVIDDNSNDGTVQMIQDEFPAVRLFCNKLNLGPSYARNIGINEANGKFILFLDSDTSLLDNDQLNRFLIFFDEHSDTGTVGGEIRIAGNKNIVYGRLISADGKSTDLSLPNRNGEVMSCTFLATCCCMVKTDIAKEIGGFDHYYGFGGEDKDFGYRIQLAGYKNYISADCAVEHYHSSAGRYIDETYRYQKTQIRFVFKFYPLYRQVMVLFLLTSLVIQFYILFLFKFIYFIGTGKKLVKEHYLGGCLIAMAMYKNICDIQGISRSRTTNFLDLEEMNNYVTKIPSE